MKRKVDRSIYRVTKRRFALSGSPPLLAKPVFPCPIKDRLVASRTAPLVASLIRERRALWIVSTSPPLPRNCRRERDKGISTEPIIDYFKKESVRVEWNNSIFFFFRGWYGELSNEEVFRGQQNEAEDSRSNQTLRLSRRTGGRV